MSNDSDRKKPRDGSAGSLDADPAQLEPGQLATGEGSRWELLVEVPGRQEAELIAGLLESAEIRSQIESLQVTQEPVNFGLLGSVRVWVVKEQLREARQLLEAQNAPPDPGPPESEPGG